MWWFKSEVPESLKAAKINRLVRILEKQNLRPLQQHMDPNFVELNFMQQCHSFGADGLINFFRDLSNSHPGKLVKVVSHIEVSDGRIFALVGLENVYEVELTVSPLLPEKLKKLKRLCSKQIHSYVDHETDKLSQKILELISDSQVGLFPLPEDISYTCSCPMWNGFCEHVAAVFYELGAMIDISPKLLFQLRSVKEEELFSYADNLLAKEKDKINSLESADLESIFGVELDLGDNGGMLMNTFGHDLKLTLVPAPNSESGGTSKSAAGTKAGKNASRTFGEGKSDNKADQNEDKKMVKKTLKTADNKPAKPAITEAKAQPKAASPARAKSPKETKPDPAVKPAVKPKAEPKVQPAAKAAPKAQPAAKAAPKVQPAAKAEPKAEPAPQVKTEHGKRREEQHNRMMEVAMNIIEAHERKANSLPRPSVFGSEDKKAK